MRTSEVWHRYPQAEVEKPEGSQAKGEILQVVMDMEWLLWGRAAIQVNLDPDFGESM